MESPPRHPNNQNDDQQDAAPHNCRSTMMQTHRTNGNATSSSRFFIPGITGKANWLQDEDDPPRDTTEPVDESNPANTRDDQDDTMRNGLMRSPSMPGLVRADSSCPDKDRPLRQDVLSPDSQSSRSTSSSSSSSIVTSSSSSLSTTLELSDSSLDALPPNNNNKTTTKKARNTSKTPTKKKTSSSSSAGTALKNHHANDTTPTTINDTTTTKRSQRSDKTLQQSLTGRPVPTDSTIRSSTASTTRRSRKTSRSSRVLKRAKSLDGLHDDQDHSLVVPNDDNDSAQVEQHHIQSKSTATNGRVQQRSALVLQRAKSMDDTVPRALEDFGAREDDCMEPVDQAPSRQKSRSKKMSPLSAKKRSKSKSRPNIPRAESARHVFDESLCVDETTSNSVVTDRSRRKSQDGSRRRSGSIGTTTPTTKKSTKKKKTAGSSSSSNNASLLKRTKSLDGFHKDIAVDVVQKQEPTLEEERELAILRHETFLMDRKKQQKEERQRRRRSSEDKQSKKQTRHGRIFRKAVASPSSSIVSAELTSFSMHW